MSAFHRSRNAGNHVCPPRLQSTFEQLHCEKKTRVSNTFRKHTQNYHFDSQVFKHCMLVGSAAERQSPMCADWADWPESWQIWAATKRWINFYIYGWNLSIWLFWTDPCIFFKTLRTVYECYFQCISWFKWFSWFIMSAAPGETKFWARQLK